MKELMKRAASSQITLGIRPENITIMKKRQPNSLKAEVIYIELIGKESNVHLEAGKIPLIAIRSSTQDLKDGDKVWLSFDDEKIHIFDGKSGKALL